MLCYKKILKDALGAINMPNLDSVGSALLITLGMVGVSVTVVALFMWLLYKFFKNREE